jgi:hypothetical protein
MFVSKGKKMRGESEGHPLHLSAMAAGVELPALLQLIQDF